MYAEGTPQTAKGCAYGCAFLIGHQHHAPCHSHAPDAQVSAHLLSRRWTLTKLRLMNMMMIFAVMAIALPILVFINRRKRK